MAKKKERGVSSRDMLPGFASAVKSRRLALGWTLKELAEKARTHYTTVYKIENEERSPSLALAAKLASALSVTIDVLLQDAAQKGMP